MTAAVIPDEVAERRARIVELTRQGVDVAAIAEMLHITTRTVCRHRKAAGIIKPKPPISTEEIRRAKLLLDDGASYKEVGRTLGRKPQAIANRLPGYGYTTEQAARASVLGRAMARLERGDITTEPERNGWRPPLILAVQPERYEWLTEGTTT